MKLLFLVEVDLDEHRYEIQHQSGTAPKLLADEILSDLESLDSDMAIELVSVRIVGSIEQGR